MKILYYTISFLFLMSITSCKMSRSKENTDISEEKVMFKELPREAIPFTLSEKGMLIETKINNVPATMLLVSLLTNNFTLDSAFVLSNIDSLKFIITKKSKWLCRGGLCSTKLVSTVNPPVFVGIGNEIREINEPMDLFYLNRTTPKIDIEAPISKILKDHILLIDVANNYLRVDISQDSLPYFIEGFEIFDAVADGNSFAIFDSLVIYNQGNIQNDKGILIIDFKSPFSFLLYEHELSDMPAKKMRIHYTSDLENKNRIAFHVDSICFSKLNKKILNEEILIKKQAKSYGYLGILGLDFFKPYCAIFDFKGQKLYLKLQE